MNRALALTVPKNELVAGPKEWMAEPKENASSDGREAGAIRLEIKELDHLGVVAKLWDELQFTEVLNKAISADEQVAIRPGVAIKALVLNIVAGRDPLYRVEHFYEHAPIEVLLGPEVRTEMLNDASLARHLDRLFDAGGEKVFSALSMQSIVREQLSIDRVHADTTSRLVFGQYKNVEEDAVSITYGYSKDHRPDLKQVMMGIATSSDGVPVVGQMLDGNQSDKTWNQDLLGVVKKCLSIEKERPLHYVGDSALITEENLRIANEQGIIITGRLPRTVNACDETVEKAMSQPDGWENLGTFSQTKNAASYRAQMFRASVLGQSVQLGVYSTTHSDERTERSVSRRQGKAYKQAKKDAERLMRSPFSCEADARRTFEAFEVAQRGKMLRIQCTLESIKVPAPAPRGRPKKGSVRSTVDQTKISIRVEKDAEAAQQAIREGSCFVLLHTGTEAISAHDLLRIYKDQSLVETRFPFLKSPYWADAFFIKTPHRLEALGYVLMTALLIWSLWERRVRINLERSKEPPLCDTTGFKKKRPTAFVNCQIMKGVKLVRFWSGDVCSRWSLAASLGAEQARLVRFSAPIDHRALPPRTEEIHALLTAG